eukprot:scaffold53588_cov59-Cyclotella_meneghiniana.AAC.8
MNRPEIIEDQHKAPNLIPIAQSTACLEAEKAKDFNPKKQPDDDGPSTSIAIPDILSTSDGAPIPIDIELESKDGKGLQWSSIPKFINGKRESPKVSPIGDLQSPSKHSSDDHITNQRSAKSSSSVHGLAVACPIAIACPVPESEDNPIEAYEHDPTANKSFYKSLRCRIYTAIALLIIGAVIAVIVVFAVKSEPPIHDDPVVEVTAPPTMKPTTVRERQIRERIEEYALTRNVSFNDIDVSDPRRLALDWILYDDGMQLSVGDPNLVQRYTLALLAFAFDLYSWDCGMVKELDSCNTTYDEDYALWLTRTDECLWFGVSCDDGIVTELDLYANNLIGEIPPEISRLGLEVLSLGDNCLYGTLPPEMLKSMNEWRIEGFAGLTEFDVSWNYLSGVVPSELFDLESLTQLNLEGNYQEGNCSRYDGTSIDMSSDGLEGNILGPDIGKLNKLESLKLSQNNFRGPISSRISKLNRLPSFRMDGNYLSGDIPEQITQLTNLKELWLGFNGIAGTIPYSIGDMKNSLSGTIPDSLYNLTNLKALHLRDNEPGFSGTIKPEVGQLTKLEEFVLSNNPLLSGTVPSELGNCNNLSENVSPDSNTNLTGSVPPEVCALRDVKLNMDYSWTESFFWTDCLPDNGILPSYIVCDCCSTCW